MFGVLDCVQWTKSYDEDLRAIAAAFKENFTPKKPFRITAMEEAAT